jgi:hypothetical protein
VLVNVDKSKAGGGPSKVMLVSDEQELKAELPIEVTLSGMVILVSELQP